MNRAYKDRLVMVNNTLIGSKRRTNNPDGFHPMIRESWSTSRSAFTKQSMLDRFRAVLGNYYTRYLSSKGTTVWNYSHPGNATDHTGDASNVGRLSTQVENIVLDLRYNPIDIDPWLHITANDQTDKKWNNFLNRSEDSTDYLKELPNFAEFMAQIFTDLSGIWISDHTSIHYAPSHVQEIREKSGQDLNIHSHYGFFVNTAPPYEELISDPSVPEYLLPNAYIMQSEHLSTSTGSASTSYNLDAISLNGRIAWFDSNTAMELDEGEYYQLYSEALQQIISDDGLSDLATKSQYFSNIGILASDKGITEEGYLSPATHPFYNKITIGKDVDSTTGYNSSNNVLEILAADDATKDFIDYLQIRSINDIISNSAPQASPYSTKTPYQVTTRTQNSAVDPTNYSFSTTVTNYTVLFKQSVEYKSALPTLAQPDLAGPIEMNELHEYNERSHGPDFILLRDASRSVQRNSFGQPIYALLNTCVDDTLTELTSFSGDAALQNFIKKYTDILAGTPCHTETLMYIIEKRRLIDGAPGDIIQRFFVSNRFDDKNIPITVYDTQVKYGQRYIYDIKKIAIVFGNRYLYHMPIIDPEPSPEEDSPQNQESLPEGTFIPREYLGPAYEDVEEVARGHFQDYETAPEPSAAEIDDHLERILTFGETFPSPGPPGGIDGDMSGRRPGIIGDLKNDLDLSFDKFNKKRGK